MAKPPMIKVNLDKVYKKLSPANIARGQVAMAYQMQLDMAPFVPKKSGDLRASGHVLPGGTGIKYNTPYARAQYYGGTYGKGWSASWSQGRTPGTGPRWDKKAKGIYGKNWPKAFMKGASL